MTTKSLEDVQAASFGLKLPRIVSKSQVVSKSEQLHDSPRPRLAHTTTCIQAQQDLAHNPAVVSQHQKLSKYHYHVKIDKTYGEKTLKLCGKCSVPANLSKDLRLLSRMVKRKVSEDEERIAALQKLEKQEPQRHNIKTKLPIAYLTTAGRKDTDQSRKFNASDFRVVDIETLSTDNHDGTCKFTF